MRTRTLLLRHTVLIFFCVLLLFFAAGPQRAYAYADDPGEPSDAVTIRITPPSSGSEGGAVVEIRVTDNIGKGFASVQVKAGEGEDWRDMTPYMEQKENQYYGALQITENCTVYVRVDASDGKLYEKSRYIDFFKGGSDALYQVNPVPEDAPVVSANPTQTDSAGESKPLTPDGQGTVVDDVTGDGKEFYTITTPAENIFYLVIDKQRDKENVYFLNAVTEADLMALAEPDNKAGNGGTSAGNASSGGASWLSGLTGTPAPEATPQPSATPTPESSPEPTPTPEKKAGTDTGTILIIGLVVLVVGGAGYYFKIYKPKREMDDAEDLEEIAVSAPEPTVNEDDLPPREIFARESRVPVPVRDETPEPDYHDAPRPYRGDDEDDEPDEPEDEPDYED